MAINIWKTSTNNAFTTTLDGAIADDTITIDLVSVVGLQAPGVLVIDRVDSNNNATPLIREYISFTGIASNQITGVTRELAGSTAQAHSSGAMVEEVWSITHWNDFLDTFAESHDSAGKIVTNSWSTFAYGADINDLMVTRHLYASGASVTGLETPIRPVWHVAGPVSLATTTVGGVFPVDKAGVWEHFAMTLAKPASGASLIVDINKNMVSIFADGFRPTIPGGGTYVSTASFAVGEFSPGDFFTVDIDAGGGTGSDMTIVGKG